MPVHVIGTLKPKNNGKFPVAEAVDIKVKDDLRLDKALENKADLATVNFALDNKADKATTKNLQSQINEIITPVTQDAEVQNARVGEDGTSYASLKNRIDSEVSSLKIMKTAFTPTYVVGGIDSGTGQNTDNDGFVRTNDYLDAAKFDHTLITGDGTHKIMFRCYGSTQEFLGTTEFTPTALPSIVTGFPANTKYVRLTCNRYYYNVFTLENWLDFSTWVNERFNVNEGDISALESTSETLREDIDSNYTDLSNKLDIMKKPFIPTYTAGGINDATGETDTSKTSWFRTDDYLDASKFVGTTVIGDGTHNVNFYCYSDTEYLGMVYITPSTEGSIGPAFKLGTTRIRFCVNRYYYPDFHFENRFEFAADTNRRLNDLELVRSNAELILPSKLVIVAGSEMTIYKENVLKTESDFVLYWYAKNYALPTNTKFDQSIRFTPTSEDIGTYTLTAQVYDKNGKTITAKDVEIEVIADTARTGKKVLFIGDSLTNAGFYPYEIQKYLSNEGVESIGSRTTTAYLDHDPNVGQVSVNHEGRGGWSSIDYTTQASKGNVSNAFWNPTSNKFDFSYYMTQQEFSSVDVVFLNLGTNSADNVSDSISSLREMIDSIRDYDANVPIVISMIACGNRTEDYYWNIFQLKLVDSYIQEFDGETDGIYLAPIYFNINRDTDFKTEEVAESFRNPQVVTRQIDGVHPSKYGYWKFADVYWATIQYVLSKGEITA